MKKMILLAVLSLFSVQIVSAASFSNDGNNVTVTPFDRKINLSQVFSPQLQGGTEAQPSSENAWSLFMKARSFRYVSDERGNDYWQTPEETEGRHAGDCEDKAVWLYAKMKESGYSSARLVIGKYRKTERKYHVWVTYADENGDTFVVDPSIQRRMWKQGEFSEGFYVPYYSYDGQNRYNHKRLGS